MFDMHKLYESEQEIQELIFDGDLRGIYTGVAVQDLATDHGWKTWGNDVIAIDYNEAVEEATTYLNDKVAKDGKYFYWEEGSFWYGKPEDDEE